MNCGAVVCEAVVCGGKGVGGGCGPRGCGPLVCSDAATRHLLYLMGGGGQLKINFRPPGINFWVLILTSEKLVDISNIKSRQREY